MQTVELQFPSGAEACAATLYLPDGDARVPCVVMAHGFSATRSEGLVDWATRFADAGLATLAFDYRHFGDSGGQPRQLVSVRHQLADYRAAIEFARSLSRVDERWIALWGISFSGGHVFELGARDRSIAAIVATIPFTDGLSAIRAAALRNVVKGIGYGVADAVAGLLGRPPVLVPAIGPPGSFAALTEHGASDWMEQIADSDTRWRNEVAARIVLTIGSRRPASKTASIACPLLICTATKDATTPPGPAQRAARRAPRGELRDYACGHFEVYDEPWLSQIVGDQVDFLVRHLGRQAT